MTKEQYLLTCLAEECAEVAQRASKAIRFGMTEREPGDTRNNRERLIEELGDLLSVCAMLDIFNLKGNAPKIVKVNRYAEYSRKLGILETLPREAEKEISVGSLFENCTCGRPHQEYCHGTNNGRTP